MEEESESLESQGLIMNTSKQCCFGLKKRLDENPAQKVSLEVMLGIGLLTQLWVCLLAGFSSGKSRKFAGLIGILIMLLVEILVLCLFALFSIFSDLTSHRINGVSLWHRQAIVRLIRNIIILLLLESSLLMIYYKIDNKHVKLLNSLIPALFLSIVTLLRYLLIKAEYNLFWLSTTFLLLVQEILLICKVDYTISIQWKYLFSPVYIECLLIVIASAYLALENRSNALDCILSVFIFTGFCVILCGIGLFILLNLSHYSIILIITGLLLVSIGTVHIFGSFLLDITLGHIEVETSTAKTPIIYLPGISHSV